MAIFLTKDSKVIVQGMTGSEGQKHTTPDARLRHQHRRRREPAQGGHDRRLRRHRGARSSARVTEAIEATGADVTVIFVPPKFTKDAVVEAIDAGIAAGRRDHRGHRRCTTPPHFWAYACQKGNKTRIIGPNCPGLITPGQSNAGIIPADITKPGRIGLVSKSGTLTYQMMYELRDIGFSTCVGIGGDPVIGTTHIDALAGVPGRPRHRR